MPGLFNWIVAFKAGYKKEDWRVANEQSRLTPIRYGKYFYDGFPSSIAKWWISENPECARRGVGTKKLDQVREYDIDKLPNAVMFTVKRFFPMGKWNLDPARYYTEAMNT